MFGAIENFVGFLQTNLQRLNIPRKPNDLILQARKQAQAQSKGEAVSEWLPIALTPQVTDTQDTLRARVLRQGFTPISLSIQTPATSEVLPVQKLTDRDQYVQELLRLKRGLTSAIRVHPDRSITPINGITAQRVSDAGGAYQIEALELKDIGVDGIRVAESRNPIERCGDGLSILQFSFLGPTGVENRVRLFFLGDGVGTAAVGDYASRILTSRAQESAIRQVQAGGIKQVENIKKLIAQASADADAYFHNIPRGAFRDAYTQECENLPTLLREGMLVNFDEKDSKGQLASSTLLALAVIDQPSNPNASLDVIYQDGGDGGFDVGAGYDYENFCFPKDYKSGVAPEQINYDTSPRKVDFYSKLINHWKFNRSGNARFTVTLRTDGLDKMKVLGKERSTQEMLDFALELSSSSRPIPILTKLADTVNDDVTYLMIRS